MHHEKIVNENLTNTSNLWYKLVLEYAFSDIWILDITWWVYLNSCVVWFMKDYDASWKNELDHCNSKYKGMNVVYAWNSTYVKVLDNHYT